MQLRKHFDPIVGWLWLDCICNERAKAVEVYFSLALAKDIIVEFYLRICIVMEIKVLRPRPRFYPKIAAT